MTTKKNIAPYYPALEAAIAEKGIKKKEIAECLGIDSQQLSKKINGEREFKISQALKIHNAFFPDINMAELFKCRRN